MWRIYWTFNFTRLLLHHITAPTITVRPEWASRAGVPFGVVDALLMRAAYEFSGSSTTDLET